jgi:aarF domain-containing kinase
MVELQNLCDKVPSFDFALAMQTIEDEFQRPMAEVFRTISPEPVAAASLGQVRFE